MTTVLITGATGNVGRWVVHHLAGQSDVRSVAAVRDPARARDQLADYPLLEYRLFDFERAAERPEVFAGVDVLFLLRPPQIADVGGVMRPLLETARAAGVRRVVFLSVLGAERSRLIPHHRIERVIRELGLDYVFVRPSYFMQNLTTTLYPEIKAEGRITLPAGEAKFNWLDTRDIGAACALLIKDFETHAGRAVELAGTDNLTFTEVATLMTEVLGRKITYVNRHPIRYVFDEWRAGTSFGRAFAVAMVHYTTRFQEVPSSTTLRELTGRPPGTLRAFLERERDALR